MSFPFSSATATPQSWRLNGGRSSRASSRLVNDWAESTEAIRREPIGRSTKHKNARLTLALPRESTGISFAAWAPFRLVPSFLSFPSFPSFSPFPSVIRDSWINARVQQIGEQIHHDEYQAKEENAPLNCREVAFIDGCQNVSADTGPGEDCFRQNRAGQVTPEVEAQDGDNRQQRVSEAM